NSNWIFFSCQRLRAVIWRRPELQPAQPSGIASGSSRYCAGVDGNRTVAYLSWIEGPFLVQTSSRCGSPRMAMLTQFHGGSLNAVQVRVNGIARRVGDT